MTDTIKNLNDKFYDACEDGNVENVKFFIEKGANNFIEALMCAHDCDYDNIVYIILCKLSSLDPNNHELKMLSESPNEEDLLKYIQGLPPLHHQIIVENNIIKIYDDDAKTYFLLSEYLKSGLLRPR